MAHELIECDEQTGEAGAAMVLLSAAVWETAAVDVESTATEEDALVHIVDIEVATELDVLVHIADVDGEPAAEDEESTATEEDVLVHIVVVDGETAAAVATELAPPA